MRLSFHWNNDQATIFTVVIYYKEDNILKHRSLAMLSDCLTHDTIVVYEFQKIITHYLKENFQLRKMKWSVIYLHQFLSPHFRQALFKHNFEKKINGRALGEKLKNMFKIKKWSSKKLFYL